jgi:hypothetical protein
MGAACTFDDEMYKYDVLLHLEPTRYSPSKLAKERKILWWVYTVEREQQSHIEYVLFFIESA